MRLKPGGPVQGEDERRDYHAMIKGFMGSSEYYLRFGP